MKDANTALTPTQIREVDARAELAVRRYFDHYLTVIVPEREKALQQHTQSLIDRHDDSDMAHGAVERRLNKAVWIVSGAAIAGSGGAVGILKLLGGLGG